MPELPRWKQDFPIASDEDSYATRREFTKFLGLTSVAFLAGTCATVLRKIWKHLAERKWNAIAVASLDEVPAGGAKLFRYPDADNPCILLRLAPDRFAAFHQNCTHLNCPVHFDAANAQLVCPCHHGFFNAADGKVLAGPPRRSLRALNVSVRDSTVWVEHDSGEGAA